MNAFAPATERRELCWPDTCEQWHSSAMNLTFESTRLRFQPLTVDDIDLVIQQWTDPEVVRYVADRIYTEEELRDEIPMYCRRCGEEGIGVWRLTEKASGEKIGTALLLPMPIELDDTDWNLLLGEGIPDGDIEVGYILKRSAWGKGFASEACARMLRFAFEETPLREVVACTDPENVASQHVLTKCGMKPLGTIRAYQDDILGFRLSREEWLAL